MNVKEIVESLRGGEIVCFPTETLYALATDAYNIKAIEKLYYIKKRSLQKPCAIMLDCVNNIKHYANINNSQLLLIQKFLPGSVTFILNRRTDCDLPEIIGKQIGIRIPSNNDALNILKSFARPIISTSANIASQINCKHFDDIPSIILSNVSSYIKNDNIISGVGSTVVDITTNPIRILRQGLLKKISL